MSPIPEAVKAAQLAELTPWVEMFREGHSELWPAPGTGVQGPAGSYRRRYAWPECWTLHTALVTELQCLKLWTEAIRAGNLDHVAAFGGGFDRWMRHIREVTAPMVQEIARVCMPGGLNFHRNPAVPMRDQLRLRVVSRGPPPESWRDLVQTTGDEVGR
jgi:hypothetical protein